MQVFDSIAGRYTKEHISAFVLRNRYPVNLNGVKLASRLDASIVIAEYWSCCRTDYAIRSKSMDVYLTTTELAQLLLED